MASGHGGSRDGKGLGLKGARSLDQEWGVLAKEGKWQGCGTGWNNYTTTIQYILSRCRIGALGFEKLIFRGEEASALLMVFNSNSQKVLVSDG